MRRPQDIWSLVCISISPKVGRRIASMAHYTQHDSTNWGEQAAQWVEILYSILGPWARIILKNMLIVIKKKYKKFIFMYSNLFVSIQQCIYLNFMPCLMREKNMNWYR